MKKQQLLVDANIISHALTKNQTKSYESLFETLETDYEFVVSGFTKYELLCSSSRDNQLKINEYITNEMVLVTLSQLLMDFTARVHNLYKKHKSTTGLSIGVGDMLNAALAIIKECPIITIDNNDYPRPFFVDNTRKRVRYISAKGRETTDTIYILHPDMENLKESFDLYNV